MSLAATGCGSNGETAIATGDLARRFAPVALIDPRERWGPTSVPRFLRHSTLWFAEDQGCPDLKVAVGRGLAPQRNLDTNWIFVGKLGPKRPYYRDRAGPSCVAPVESGNEYYTSQRTRPYDTVDRPRHLRAGEGFYLDLEDAARRGPPLVDARVYVERREASIDGEPGQRLTYWMLFGMHEPLDRRRRPIRRASHEGDWERLDILLKRDDERYAPVELIAGRRRVGWSSTTRDGGTHPLVTITRGDHSIVPVADRPCAGCTRWRTWRALETAESQEWYGFGGAWGDVGAAGRSTGPIGPHERWIAPRPPGVDEPDIFNESPDSVSEEERRIADVIELVYAALRRGDVRTICRNYRFDGSIAVPETIRLGGDLSSCHAVYTQIVRKAKRRGLFDRELDIEVDYVNVDGDEAEAHLSSGKGGTPLPLIKSEGRWMLEKIDYTPTD